MIRLPLFRPLAVVTAVVIGTACAATRAASAGTFDDFRVPEHHMLTWTGSFSGRSDWGSSFRSARSEWSGNGSGSAYTQASGLAESDASLTTWGLRASADGYRAHDLSRTEPAWASYWQEQETWSHSLWESFEVSGTRRWWLTGNPLHVVAGASALGNYNQGWSWNRLDQRVPTAYLDPAAMLRSEDKDQQRSWFHQVVGTAGVGVGRTRDATGAYEARLLEDRLRDAGLLAHPLSAEARRALAGLLTVRRDVSATRDNPAAPVWAAIQRVLAADGALRGEALSAEAWFRLIEPWFARWGRTDASLVPASPMQRLRGWLLEACVEGRTSQQVNHWSTAYSQFFIGSPEYYTSSDDQRVVYRGDRGAAGLAGEAHWPLGMHLQVDASASALADLRPGQHGIDQDLNAAAHWLAASRWLATLSVAQARTCFSGRGTSLADDNWSVQYGAEAQYAVTDRVGATLQFTQTHGRVGQNPALGGSYWQMNHRGAVSFGLTYRLAGRASAPGLFPAR